MIDLSKRWQVIEGDALAVLPTLAEGSIDLIATDPPFFRVKSEDWDRQWKSGEAYLEWLGRIADEWARVLAPNGSLYCFSSPDMCDSVAGVLRERFTILNRIRWVKENGWHRKAERESLRSFLSPWEEIVFAEHRGADGSAMDASGYDEAAMRLHQRVYAPIGKKVQEKRQAAKLERWQVDTACAPSRKPTGLCYRWEEGACLPTEDQWVALCRLVGDGREYEDLRREYEDLRREYEDLRREYEDLRRPFSLTGEDHASDIWTFSVVPARPNKHVCEKPVDLMAYIVNASTRPGALVLDCFSGSGTTGVACRNTDRRFIGVEQDGRWANRSRRRIAEAANTLFTPEAEPVPDPALFVEKP